MSIDNEKILQLRVFDGIDLNIDARVTDPRAWKVLSNVYGKTPGRLTKRPGSRIHVDTFELDNRSTELESTWDMWTNDHMLQPDGFDVTDQIQEITGLGSLPVTGSTKDVLVGSVSTHYTYAAGEFTVDSGINARLFYVRGGVAYIMGVPENCFKLGSTPFQIIPAINAIASCAGDFIYGVSLLKRVFADNSCFESPGLTIGTSAGITHDARIVVHRTEDVAAIVGYATNKIGPLLVIFNAAKASVIQDTVNLATPPLDLSTDNSIELKAAPFVCMTSSATADGANYVGHRKWYRDVQCISTFAGSLVIGGYTYIITPDEGYVNGADLPINNNMHKAGRSLPHYIAFSDVDNPHIIGELSNLKVGSSAAEPVTGLGLITTETDTEGLRGQLAVFTTRKTVVYDGMPPQSDTPAGDPASFRQSMNFGLGCVAQRSIVQTPVGLVFLATDGVIYILRGLEGLLPIGRAIEPALNKYSLAQQEKASATFEDGFYKISLPPSNVFSGIGGGIIGGGTAPVSNTDQFWGDIRNIKKTPEKFDMGVKWSGPHKGQALSIFTVAKGITDAKQVYAGIDGTNKVAEVSVENLTTDYTTSDIKLRAQTPEVDLGDAHSDKIYYGTEMGVGVNKEANINLTVAVVSGENCSQNAQQYSDDVLPCTDVWGTDWEYGDGSAWGGYNDFSLYSKKSSGRIRGRVFQATITEDSDAQVSFSDFSMKFRPSKRRG